MTNRLIISKPCCNCGEEITLAKQKCPHCHENNEWKPELGIKPYLAFNSIWYFFIYPAFFPILYLVTVGDKPIFPYTVTIPYFIVTITILLVGVGLMSKNFELGKFLLSLDLVLSFLFAVLHFKFGESTIFEGFKYVILFVNVVIWFYISNSFHSLETKYENHLDRIDY